MEQPPERMQAGLLSSTAPELTMSQKDIVAALVFLATERALRAAATLCEHEDRLSVTADDIRMGFQSEILFGCGPALERVVARVAQGRYDECSAEEADFLREAVASYGTEAMSRVEESDGSSDEDEEEEEEEEEEATPCDCESCRRMRVDAPALWETWAARQTPGTFGFAAREALLRLGA